MISKEVEKILKENGLVLSSTEVVDTTAKKDTIVEQSPKDGSPVQKGDSVILTVSSGKTTLNKSISLPANVGIVSVRVDADGNTVTTENVDTKAHSSFSFNVAGDKESDIKVYINDALYYEAKADFGKDPVRVSDEKYHSVTFYVDVVGMNVDEARSMLSNAGYKNIMIQEQESSESEGVVLNQSPSQSSAPNLDKTATIVLTVSKKKSDTNVDATVEDTSDVAQVQ